MADLAGVTVITEDELDSSTLAIAIEQIFSMFSFFFHYSCVHNLCFGNLSQNFCESWHILGKRNLNHHTHYNLGLRRVCLLYAFKFQTDSRGCYTGAFILVHAISRLFFLANAISRLDYIKIRLNCIKSY